MGKRQKTEKTKNKVNNKHIHSTKTHKAPPFSPRSFSGFLIWLQHVLSESSGNNPSASASSSTPLACIPPPACKRVAVIQVRQSASKGKTRAGIQVGKQTSGSTRSQVNPKIHLPTQMPVHVVQLHLQIKETPIFKYCLQSPIMMLTPHMHITHKHSHNTPKRSHTHSKFQSFCTSLHKPDLKHQVLYSLKICHCPLPSNTCLIEHL